MANNSTNVKLSRRIAGWIDTHPRTGWYVAFWAVLVSADAAIGWVERILHAIK